jgi:hypothetical protein
MIRPSAVSRAALSKTRPATPALSLDVSRRRDSLRHGADAISGSSIAGDGVLAWADGNQAARQALDAWAVALPLRSLAIIACQRGEY